MSDCSIKTIVFDLGGVYFSRGSTLAVEKILDIYNLKNDHIRRELVIQTFGDKYKKEGCLIRQGKITIDEFEERLCSKLGLQEQNKQNIRYIWFGSYLPHYQMDEVVKELKRQKFRLIIFSGNIRERVEFLNKRYNFLQYFDDFIYSYDFQMNKRDFRFYDVLLEHLECEPNEAIMIDDHIQVINRAKTKGLNGIQYYYTKQLINDFKKYNIDINL